MRCSVHFRRFRCFDLPHYSMSISIVKTVVSLGFFTIFFNVGKLVLIVLVVSALIVGVAIGKELIVNAVIISVVESVCRSVGISITRACGKVCVRDGIIVVKPPGLRVVDIILRVTKSSISGCIGSSFVGYDVGCSLYWLQLILAYPRRNLFPRVVRIIV